MDHTVDALIATPLPDISPAALRPIRAAMDVVDEFASPAKRIFRQDEPASPDLVETICLGMFIKRDAGPDPRNLMRPYREQRLGDYFRPSIASHCRIPGVISILNKGNIRPLSKPWCYYPNTRSPIEQCDMEIFRYICEYLDSDLLPLAATTRKMTVKVLNLLTIQPRDLCFTYRGVDSEPLPNRPKGNRRLRFQIPLARSFNLVCLDLTRLPHLFKATKQPLPATLRTLYLRTFSQALYLTCAPTCYVKFQKLAIAIQDGITAFNRNRKIEVTSAANVFLNQLPAYLCSFIQHFKNIFSSFVDMEHIDPMTVGKGRVRVETRVHALQLEFWTAINSCFDVDHIYFEGYLPADARIHNTLFQVTSLNLGRFDNRGTLGLDRFTNLTQISIGSMRDLTRLALLPPTITKFSIYDNSGIHGVSNGLTQLDDEAFFAYMNSCLPQCEEYEILAVSLDAYFRGWIPTYTRKLAVNGTGYINQIVSAPYVEELVVYSPRDEIHLRTNANFPRLHTVEFKGYHFGRINWEIYAHATAIYKMGPCVADNGNLKDVNNCYYERRAVGGSRRFTIVGESANLLVDKIRSLRYTRFGNGFVGIDNTAINNCPSLRNIITHYTEDSATKNYRPDILVTTHPGRNDWTCRVIYDAEDQWIEMTGLWSHESRSIDVSGSAGLWRDAALPVFDWIVDTRESDAMSMFDRTGTHSRDYPARHTVGIYSPSPEVRPPRRR